MSATLQREALWSCSVSVLFYEACFCFNLSVHVTQGPRFLLDLAIKAQDNNGWY